MEFLNTPAQLILTAGLVGTTALVLLRGDGPARLALAGVLAASILSPLVQTWDQPNAVQWRVMGVDALLLAHLGLLTWRWNRSWLIWAAAFQLLTVATHVGMALSGELLGRAYIGSSYLLFAGLLVSLALGALRRRPPG